MRSLEIERPPKPRLANLVYEKLLHAILTGIISPNERLHQERLAESLQVSRTPVREALLRLENEHILTSGGSGGFEIRKATPAEIGDIYQTREAVEGYSAGFLAENASRADLDGIRAVIKEQEGGTYQLSGEYYEANRRIHRSFVEATGNDYLLEVFDGMWNRGISMVTFSTMTEDSLKATITGHDALLDVIETRDPAAARQAMRDHIGLGLEVQLQTL